MSPRVEVHVGFGDAGIGCELLKQQRAERLLRTRPIGVGVTESTQVAKDLHVRQVDLERRVVVLHRALSVAHTFQRTTETMVELRELLTAALAKAGDDLLQHGHGIALPTRGNVDVAERKKDFAVVGCQFSGTFQIGDPQCRFFELVGVERRDALECGDLLQRVAQTLQLALENLS